MEASKDQTTAQKTRTRRQSSKKASKKKSIKAKQFTNCNRSLIKGPTIFTKDSNYLLCTSGKHVSIYCRKTGLLDTVFKGHSSDINNIFINESNPLQVISTDVSGEVLFWDHTDCKIEQKYKLPFPALSIYPNPKAPESLYCVIYNELKAKSRLLVKTSLQDASIRETIGSISKAKKSVVFDAQGKFAVYIDDNEICLYNIAKSKLKKYIYDGETLSCVACHPSELKVVTGDSQGKIVIWHGLQAKDVVCVQLHWHHSQVADCVFSADGNYLISGGNEATLVMWQLETQEPSFVPRMGSSIKHITVSQDTKYVCVSLASNTIKILAAADSKLVSSVKGLAPSNKSSNCFAVDPITNSLVIQRGSDGMLQFYDPYLDNVMEVVDVIGENPIAAVKERPVFTTNIHFIAFNTEGSWMATVDHQSDVFLVQSWKLKFWVFNKEQKKYLMNTVVDPVHEKKVNGLAFRPNRFESHQEMAVTTSDDGNFKLWVLNEETSKTGTIVKTWLCQAVGIFGTGPCTSGSFSDDGSLLAVLYDDVTMWNCDPLVMKSNFGSNLISQEIKHVAFGRHESSHYLIGNTEKNILVWDSRTWDVVWCVEAFVSFITIDDTSKYFAAFVWNQANRTSPLYLFDPSSPKPIASVENVSGGENDVRCATFVRRKDKTFCDSNNLLWNLCGKLYFLNQNSDVFTIKDLNEKEAPSTNKVEVAKGNSIEDLFKLGIARRPTGQDINVPAQKTSSALFNTMTTTPSHILPPVDIMFCAFAKSLLLTKDANEDDDDKYSEVKCIEGGTLVGR